MIRFAKVVGLAVGIAAFGSASARHYDDDGYRATHYEWARVVSVDPIIDRYDEPVSREVCESEPVRYYEPRHRHHSRDVGGETLVGAVIGGALGNLAGKGDGRKAATIAGALIGGSIAHDNARRHDRVYDHGGYAYRGYEDRCHVETDYRSNERVTGYDVAYNFRGRLYHVTTDAHPGRRIQVEVDERGRPIL